MRKNIYRFLLNLSGLGIPVLAYGIVNTTSKLKTEVNNPGDCISQVSGVNLCVSIHLMESGMVLCVVILIMLLLFRKRILRY